MRRSAWLLLGCAIPIAGLACNGGSASTPDPITQADPAPTSKTVFDGVLPETAVGRFHVEVDLETLTATVTPVDFRSAQAQPPQAISYDLDIDQFRTPTSLQFSAIRRNIDGDLELTFTHAHPFPAPDFTRPISGSNRADLSYTGRLVILSDLNSESYFGGDAVLDPSLVTDADGYVDTGDLLANQTFTNSVFPYVLLADDGEDNRVGTSNGGSPEGNYGATGWQRSNIGSGNAGWTGFDYVHGGQTVSNSFTLSTAAITASSYSFDAAILIKYTDPRGAGGRTLRFPPTTADVLQFAYRLPFAALDASKVTGMTSDLIGTANGSTGAVHFEARDWDAMATEAADADLSDETDVSLVQPGASGTPVADVDAPFLSATPATIAAGAGDTGHPGDEVIYDGVLVNSLATATAGDYLALIRLTDPEDGDPAASAYHFGVDPVTITPSATRALAVKTYQVLPITVGSSLQPPVISQVTPTGSVGCPGAVVNFNLTATNTPTSWAWNFGGGANPNTSALESPSPTLLAPGSYSASVTATNAAGTSPPFNFVLTVDAPWAFHDIDNDAVNNRVWQSNVTMYNNSPVLASFEMIAGATEYTYNMRVSFANSPNPTATANWTSHQVLSFLSPLAVSINGSFVSPIVVNNRLAIVYYDSQLSQRRIVIANSPSPFIPASAADWTIHTVDALSGGFHQGVTMHNGQLVVTYRTLTGNDLKLARATVAVPAGPADWALHTVDPSANATGLYSAPLSYNPGTGARLYVIHRDSAAQSTLMAKANIALPASSADWTTHTVEAVAGGIPGLYLQMVETSVGGSPRLAFYGIDASVSAPRFDFYQSNIADPSAAAHWNHVVLAPVPAGSGGQGFGGDIGIYNGRIVVAYPNIPAAGQMQVVMARALVENPTSLSDFQTTTVDATSNGGLSTGNFPYVMVMGNNELVIAHRNMANYIAGNSAWRFERSLCTIP